jgi:hypothetical protein
LTAARGQGRLAVGVRPETGSAPAAADLALVPLSAAAFQRYAAALDGTPAAAEAAAAGVTFYAFPEGDWDPHYTVRGLLDDDVPLAFESDAEPGPPVEVHSARAEASEFGIAFSAIEATTGRRVRTSRIPWKTVRGDTESMGRTMEGEHDEMGFTPTGRNGDALVWCCGIRRFDHSPGCGCIPPEGDGDTAPLGPQCTCSANPYDYAPCPYDLEVEGEEIECNCCLSCRERCAENI